MTAEASQSRLSVGRPSAANPFLSCGCPLCQAASPVPDGLFTSASTDGSALSAFVDGTFSSSAFADGTASPQFAAATVPSSAVAALLPSGTPRWGGGLGTAATVTYSFMAASPSYAQSSDRLGFAAMSAAQRTAVRQALAAWSEVANIVFTEVADTGNGGSIRFGTNRQGGSSAAYAYYPGGTLYGTGGDVYLANDATTNSSAMPGSYGFKTILHEIGHAIGLKHPGNYNAAGGGSEGPYLSSAEDNYRYTLMSYNSHPSLGFNGLGTGPALYDIAAVQYLYGANTQTRLGDTVYASTNTAFSLSIWDGGGTDTLDAGQQTAAVTINLNGGAFSSIGPNGSGGRAVDNLSIAYGVVIENAIGGAGNDVLVGNDAGNVLTGGAGDDTLTGGAGDDTLDGGTGTDTAVFSGNRADYAIAADGATNGAAVVVTHGNGGADGTDRLTGVEYAQFADRRVSLLAPVVTGTGRTVFLGSTVAAGTLLTVSDPAVVTAYELVDQTAAGGYLTLAGVAQPADTVVAVSGTGLGGVAFAGSALGTDRIAIRVNNGTLWSGWTTLTVATIPNNRPPALQADKTLHVQEGAGATALGIATPADPEGDAMTVALTALPGSGTVRLAGGAIVTAGSALTAADLAGLTYTPAAGFAGSAGRFAYTVTDAQGAASRQAVTLTVDSLGAELASFNPFTYLASNLDLVAVFGLDGEAARRHYINAGRFEGRATASFEPMAYLVRYPDLVGALGIDATAAARHYLSAGRFEGRSPSGFDPLAYLAANPDLAAAFGTDTTAATRHYLSLGLAEGRGTVFNADAYLAANPDLADAFGTDRTSTLRHYITLGRAEGRATGFDALSYLAANPDLAAAFGTDTAAATRHYATLGHTEGRSLGFDAGAYLAANPDLVAAFGSDTALATQHFILHGRLEQRPLSPLSATVSGSAAAAAPLWAAAPLAAAGAAGLA
ncbi:M10 family metallopeptidase C-terminal domain-containing protein [Azospirillum doebereinerae]|uniref:Matrixin family metalloprotease n=1 Tax=Azospirillum doebereinerae TaxID=92933 RepID=A0A3S0WKV5_9PROT|nr:M10 family metallopeptidase C-terminal domain-containing protein [Azospirillum doebereinerae]RUQ68833.1 matrixin family metalloprotease [Azospirillum doebereinerae]